MSYKLSSIQRDLVLGTILGDGNLEYPRWRGSRLQIKQMDGNKEYVLWLHSKLRSICKSLPKQRKDTKQWYFGTRYTRDLRELYEVFYKNRQKVVPKSLKRNLKNPISLAVWYMDDGRLDFRPKDHYAYTISTDSFSVTEVGLLKEILEENFGVRCNIHTPLCRGKRYPKLYIGSEGRDKFLSLIKPYILDCFKHKIPTK